MTNPARHPAPGPLTAIACAWAGMLDFGGCARRWEFNWYVAYVVVVMAAALALDHLLTARAVTYPYAKLGAVVLTLPGLALAVRRLHDTGWRGWVVLASLVPVLGAVLTLFLMLRKSRPGRARFEDRTASRRQQAMAAGGLALLVAVAAKYEAYTIPAGSMKPTLLIGDYVVADKFAWGLPCFGLCGATDRIMARDPAPGEVAIFLHPVIGVPFVKRVIGVPGDTVQLRDGALWRNGEPVPRDPVGRFEEPPAPQGPARSRPICMTEADGICIKERWREHLRPGIVYDVLETRLQSTDETAEIRVPDGHFFVMGDNRDNSIDSRIPPIVGGVGLVPRENFVARARLVAVSSAGVSLWEAWRWRKDRFFRRVQ